MLFRSFCLASVLALSTSAWANNLTNLERVHHVGAVAQDQESLLEGWAQTRAVQLKPVFGNYYLVMGKEGSALDKGWSDSLPAGTQTLAVFREAQKTALKISDGRLRFRLTEAGQVRAVSRALAGFAPKFSIVHQKTRVYEAVINNAEAVIEASRAMNALADTLWATPDFIYKKSLKGETNDPLLESQWHHAWIGSRAAWDISQGSAEVVIAIIDSGVDMEHPSFEGKLVAPYDPLDRDQDPTPDYSDAHGTSCAGLAAAKGNDSFGGIGVCPNCSIMPIRILSESGYSRYGADSDAFRWAVDNGAQILSNSWGTIEPSQIPPNLADAIVYAADTARDGKGAVVLFAAGNDSRENEPYELASHPMVLGVAATSSRDYREYYSNFGDDVDISAPAGAVTEDMLGAKGYADGDFTYSFGGTSAATPVVAGVAGLILSLNPELTRGQVYEVLTSSTDKIGNQPYVDGFNKYYGFGRVNAYRALQTAVGGEICQPVDEICDNGLDDDCDGLTDERDPSCAPELIGVGIACVSDLDCGSEATCLGEDYGFPNGYCTVGCEGTCPDDGVCAPIWQGQSACFDSCSVREDCRDGYDCLDMGGATACVPSCTVSGCGQGEMCNEQTGDCYHDGPIAAGGPCTDSVECANDGFCFSEAEYGVLGGYCGDFCNTDADCGEGFGCENFGRFDMCTVNCQYNDDCRDGYVCYPTDDNPEMGMCWESCFTAGCEEGSFCNQYGLCGDEMPPFGEERPDNPINEGGDVDEGGSAPVCACDTTWACSEGCECDPECIEGKDGDSGCNSAGAELWWFLMMLGALQLTIRRRRILV